jgi:hypothetical protein
VLHLVGGLVGEGDGQDLERADALVRMRWAMRWVSTRVLPEPAPATTSSGPSSWTTASSWTGLSRGAKTPASIDAMARMGTTERDMPPLLIRSSGKAAGFRHLAVYDRPTDPALITDATLPRVAGIVEFVKRFAVRATPLALTRGHYVVLTK